MNTIDLHNAMIANEKRDKKDILNVTLQLQ